MRAWPCRFAVHEDHTPADWGNITTGKLSVLCKYGPPLPRKPLEIAAGDEVSDAS
jgi:hypothetical protein